MAEQIAGGLGPGVLTLDAAPSTPWGANGSATNGHDGSGGVLLATAPPSVRFTATAEAEIQPRRRKRIVIRHASGDRVAVGDALPEIPLFLEPDLFVPVPLDDTYTAAFADVPDRYRVELV